MGGAPGQRPFTLLISGKYFSTGSERCTEFDQVKKHYSRKLLGNRANPIDGFLLCGDMNLHVGLPVALGPNEIGANHYADCHSPYSVVGYLLGDHGVESFQRRGAGCRCLTEGSTGRQSQQQPKADYPSHYDSIELAGDAYRSL
jgi:hypothetical protein